MQLKLKNSIILEISRKVLYRHDRLRLPLLTTVHVKNVNSRACIIKLLDRFAMEVNCFGLCNRCSEYELLWQRRTHTIDGTTRKGKGNDRVMKRKQSEDNFSARAPGARTEPGDDGDWKSIFRRPTNMVRESNVAFCLEDRCSCWKL